jgi:hypothetical protein
MKEFGEISPNEVILCDPTDITDIANKIDFCINKLQSNKDRDLFNLCYMHNNKSFINLFRNLNYNIDDIKIKQTNKISNNTINYYLNTCNNKDKVKVYEVNLPASLYKFIINIFDINIQIRLTNGGGGSGSVADSCFLNKFILTTEDLYKNCINNNYKNVITSSLTKNKDLYKVMDDDVKNITNKIKKNKTNIMKYNEGVNIELSKRLIDYPVKLIKFLNLNKNSKICFVTPYGNDNSGISDFSYRTIHELSNYIEKIDIYTDCHDIDFDKQSKNITFYKINQIKNNKGNYDEIIWVIGNSSFHDKMILYGKEIGGTFLIHDETLYELYVWNKWVPSKLQPIEPFKLRESGSDIDYSYLCFHDICNKPENKIIVHNHTLENIFKKNYGVKNITTIDYPNYNLNLIDKLNKDEIEYIRNKLNIDNKKLNLLIIGGFSPMKLPAYSFKLLDSLIKNGIDTELYIFYNKS